MPDAENMVSLTELEKRVTAELSPQAGKYMLFEGMIKTTFDKFRDARRKSGVEQGLIDSLYLFYSKYSSDVISKLQASGMSEVNFGLVGEKCVDALAWLSDVFLGEMGKPWRIDPTPAPRVPIDVGQMALASGARAIRQYVGSLGREPGPEDSAKIQPLVREEVLASVRTEAMRRAKDMEKRIEDQLGQGNWDEAFEDFIFDCVVMKAGIMKGPVLRKKQVRTWTASGIGAKIQYRWEDVPTFSRVSPFDAYPSPSTVDFEGDFIERMRFTISDMFWMAKQKHFIQEQVKRVISQFSVLAGSGLDSVDNEVAALLQGQTGDGKVDGTVEGLDCWLTMTGSALKTAGWDEFPDGKKIDPEKLYNIEAITVAGYLVMLVENDDPRGVKPYYHTSWIRVPGAFWGISLPEHLKDLADVCNSDVRSLVNNMGLSSGFQTIIPDVQRIIPGTKLTNIFPHKVWQFRNPTNSAMPPILFQQPDSNASVLLAVLEKFRELADVRSGVPKYLLGGEPPPGVGRTASGISMLLNSAAKGIRRVVVSIDRKVVCPLISSIYDLNLSDVEDAGVLGDAEIVASGSVETLMRAELAERRLGLLTAISQSEVRGVVSFRGMAELWREAFRSAEMDVSQVIEPVEKVEQKMEAKEANEQQALLAQSQAAQAEAAARQLEAQTAQVRLQVEQQRLQMENQILQLKLQAQIAENQQRAAITKRMAANADLKTAKEIGAANVPTDEELENEAVRGERGIEEANEAAFAEPDYSGPGVGNEGAPGIPG